jgi:hypothetical protein
MRLALILAVAACHSSLAPSGSSVSASYRDSVQALCDLPDHVPPKDKPYPERLAAVARWANDHVTDKDVRAAGSIDKDLNKEKVAGAVKRAGIAHCKLLDNDMALQSFAEAMQDICDAPAGDRETLSAYYKSHLLNPDVIAMFSALAELNPADAKLKLADYVKRAGITNCALQARTP